MGGRHWTRSEVIRSPFFWLLIPMLLGPPAWGTSLFFQQVHIAEMKGWPLVSYLGLIPVLMAVSMATTLASGMLIDRYGSGALLRIYLVPWMLGFVHAVAGDNPGGGRGGLCRIRREPRIAIDHHHRLLGRVFRNAAHRGDQGDLDQPDGVRFRHSGRGSPAD